MKTARRARREAGKLVMALAALALAPAGGFAQPVATIVNRPSADQNVLRAGTEIRFNTRTELSSRTSRVGDRFDLEVVEPVMLQGQIVIPAGSLAVGEVTRVRRKGMWGRRGILETRLLHVQVGDRQFRITGAAGDRGRAGVGGVAAAALTIPVAGFFITGTSAVIPPRTLTIGYLNEDIEVALAPERAAD